MAFGDHFVGNAFVRLADDAVDAHWVLDAHGATQRECADDGVGERAGFEDQPVLLVQRIRQAFKVERDYDVGERRTFIDVGFRDV